MNDEIRKQFGSVPIYRCPSKFGGGPFITDTPAGAGDDSYRNSPPYGPRISYAFVLSFNRRPVSTGLELANSGHWARGERLWQSVDAFFGPFRIALHDEPLKYATWGPRDTMAWWSDGSSNQILVGEKHLPPAVFGRCEGGTLTPETTMYFGDCSYLVGGEGYSTPVARLVRASTVEAAACDVNSDTDSNRPLARVDDESNTVVAWNGARFGSAHPSVVNFLIGDGAVRPFFITTTSRVMAALGTVNDGNTVSVPGLN